MADTPPPPSGDEALEQTGTSWRLLVIFPAALLIFFLIMVLVVKREHRHNEALHRSMGRFVSGSTVSGAGIKGTVRLEQEDDGSWSVSVWLLPEAEGAPIGEAKVRAHSIIRGKYERYQSLKPGNLAGMYEGNVGDGTGMTAVMVHVDLPGGVEDEWVAEFTPLVAPPGPP